MRTCRAWRALCRQRTHQWRGICSNEPRPFGISDLVLLRQVRDQAAPPILTRPLQPGKLVESHRGIIKHENIIGKSARDIVRTEATRKTSNTTEYRIHPVTLHDYVLLSRRIVTPIYPEDANLVVSLLDLHPGPPLPGEENAPTLEILEAGTGHGALTLHLSRAIHGANPPRPCTTGATETEAEEELRRWKSRRRAVLHTIDVSPRISAHARRVVHGFRHGLYAHNADFHVGDASEWLAARLPERDGRAFLSHAILDMPDADAHLSGVADALVADGTLVVFNPSITQIGQSVRKVRDERIPLSLERVVELGVNGGSGGREWDVRLVRPRRRNAAEPGDAVPDRLDHAVRDVDGAASVVSGEAAASGVGRAEDSEGGMDDPDDQTRDTASITDDDTRVDGRRAEEIGDGSPEDAEGRVMVCRPKVGGRVSGGGFLGIWKKQR